MSCRQILQALPNLAVNGSMVHIYTISVGVSFARPTFRGSGIALFVWTSNAEAHALVYKQILGRANKGYPTKETVIYTLHGRSLLLCLWRIKRNCQIPERQAQSASNAFSIYRSPSAGPPESGLRQGNGCKCTTNLWKTKNIWRKNVRGLTERSV